ncbi:unnamed protein product [Musa textilis]
MTKIGFPLDSVIIFKGFLCCDMLLIIMDVGLPKCSEQWMHLFCAGLVGPHYFQVLFFALMCTSWSFDTVLIKIWLVVFIYVKGKAYGHLVLHEHKSVLLCSNGIWF